LELKKGVNTPLESIFSVIEEGNSEEESYENDDYRNEHQIVFKMRRLFARDWAALYNIPFGKRTQQGSFSYC